ncbi:MAG: amidohydrolase family protein [Acidimicrobiia bacterium]
MIDAHVHVVAGDRDRYPVAPPGVGSRWFDEHPADADGFAEVSGPEGVERAVLVQAYGAYGTDNSYVLDAADAASDRFASVVVLASDDPALDARLDECVARPSFRGVRVFAIGDPAPNPLDHPGTRAIFAAARERGFPLVAATLPDGLDPLRALLRDFPDVPVALDHCGFAPAPVLRPLAAHDNLHLKVTAHVLEEAIDPRLVVEELVASFGAARLAWGSDFPQVDDHTYGELVALGASACDGLTDTDRERVLAGTAEALWW